MIARSLTPIVRPDTFGLMVIVWLDSAVRDKRFDGHCETAWNSMLLKFASFNEVR